MLPPSVAFSGARRELAGKEAVQMKPKSSAGDLEV